MAIGPSVNALRWIGTGDGREAGKLNGLPSQTKKLPEHVARGIGFGFGTDPQGIRVENQRVQSGEPDYRGP